MTLHNVIVYINVIEYDVIITNNVHITLYITHNDVTGYHVTSARVRVSGLGSW